MKAKVRELNTLFLLEKGGQFLATATGIAMGIFSLTRSRRGFSILDMERTFEMESLRMGSIIIFFVGVEQDVMENHVALCVPMRSFITAQLVLKVIIHASIHFLGVDNDLMAHSRS